MARVRRWWRRARVPLLILLAIVFGPVIVALIGVGLECRVFGGAPTIEESPDDPAPVRQVKAGLADYRRSEDQTYLTFPEWYIVYSAEEYAAVTAGAMPSHFPYFRATAQYWQSYYDVCAVTRDRYPFNSGYHLSLVVIGSSFTIENVLRGLYENTLGRISEWTAFGQLTEEDRYAHAVASEYGAFLHTIPWYEFPYGAKLVGLWSETGLWGPHIIRKWERKLALSAEYGGKAVYALLIKGGTGSVYAGEDEEILLWAEDLSDEIFSREPALRLVAPIDAQSAIVALPRYEAFTRIVPRLAQDGVRFVEIAGNDEILITALAPRDLEAEVEGGQSLFEQPILTAPERKRVALNVPVKSLHLVLNQLESAGMRLEHIYDY